jgi:hypothetical protein
MQIIRIPSSRLNVPPFFLWHIFSVDDAPPPINDQIVRDQHNIAQLQALS